METQNDKPLRRDYLPAVRWELDGSICMVTVRMPIAVHTRLTAEAYVVGTSLNSLCLSKLLAEIVDCPIAPEGTRRAAYARFWQRRETELFVEKKVESQESRVESENDHAKYNESSCKRAQ